VGRIDYKFFVFDGRAQFGQVDTDRATQHKRVFYNRDWVRQPFSLEYLLETQDVERPEDFREMRGLRKRSDVNLPSYGLIFAIWRVGLTRRDHVRTRHRVWQVQPGYVRSDVRKIVEVNPNCSQTRRSRYWLSRLSTASIRP